MTDAAVSLSDVSLSFGDLTVLDGVSVETDARVA